MQGEVSPSKTKVLAQLERVVKTFLVLVIVPKPIAKRRTSFLQALVRVSVSSLAEHHRIEALRLSVVCGRYGLANTWRSASTSSAPLKQKIKILPLSGITRESNAATLKASCRRFEKIGRIFAVFAFADCIKAAGRASFTQT